MKKGFVRRMIRAVLILSLCLTTALAGGSTGIVAHAAQISPTAQENGVNGTLDAPYLNDSDDLLDIMLDESLMAVYDKDSSRQKITKINVAQGGALILGLTATEKGQKYMNVSLYEDAACTKPVPVKNITEDTAEDLGFYQNIYAAKVKVGTYYQKTVLKKTDQLIVIGYVISTTIPSELPLKSVSKPFYVEKKTSAYVKMQVKQDGIVNLMLSEGKITLCNAQKKALTAAKEELATYTLKAGTYYLKLTDIQGAVGLSGQLKKCAVLANTTKAKALEITPGTASSSMIPLGNKSRTRWYKMKVSSDRTDQLKLTNNGENILHYYVYRGSTGIASGAVLPGKQAVIQYTNEKKKIWKKGTYYIKLEEKNPSDNCTFEVRRGIYIQNLKVKKVLDQTYTGRLIEPAVVLTDGTTKLKEGIDYQVSYRNNQKVGKAKIIIKAKGKYKGSRTITFKILPKKNKTKK